MRNMRFELAQPQTIVVHFVARYFTGPERDLSQLQIAALEQAQGLQHEQDGWEMKEGAS